jgi:hypothetical protein
MSERNGDKARFGRERKRNIRRRQGIRELRKALESKTPGTEVAGSKQEENRILSLEAVTADRQQ